MITRSIRLVCNSVIALFLLLIFSGCAQTRANIKAADAVDKNGPAVIKSINATENSIQIEVQTDKPLSYTYYKTSDPPKVVIDLAQTDPGTVDKTVELNTGNIKRIDVARHEFTGGFLSRVEIALGSDESDFTVKTDPANEGKLLIDFPKAVVEEKPGTIAKEEPIPASNVVSEKTSADQQVENQVNNTNDKHGTGIETATTQQSHAEIVAAQPAPNVVPDKQQVENSSPMESAKSADPVAAKTAQPKVLSAITVDDKGIEISVNGGIDKYNVFKLTKPDRIVLDLPEVRSRIATKSVAIDKFAVSQARLGIYPDKVRVVLDASKNGLPSYQVIKNGEGLKVVFNTESTTSGSNVQLASAKPEIIEKKVVANKKSSIEAIDFKIVDENSRIIIKTSGNCNAVKPVKVSGGLSLTIKDCQLPKKFQRMIDTSAFPSVVKMVTPFQVKFRKENDARIVVKLRQATTSVLRQEGDTLFWDIKNPENVNTAGLKEKSAQEVPGNHLAAPLEADRTPPPQTIKTAIPHVAQPINESNKKIYTGRRVSLEFTDADIRKILQLIAEVSNLNFIIGDDVSGTISIKLVNVPWDQALEVILDSKGLEKRQDGNILYIKPKGKFKTEEQEEAEARKERESRMELKTKVFDINFAEVGDIAKQFEKLRSDRGTIAQDSRTNRVIVTDNEERLGKMRDLLKDLDLPEKQVMIEARMIEATSTFARDLGVQWGIHYSDPTASVLGMNTVDVGLGGIITPPPVAGTFISNLSGGEAGITFGKVGAGVNVDLRLSAAATIGQIKIISSPKVLTLNNKKAKISQGTSIPYQSQTATEITTIFVEAALTLEVTPHVAADGTITMKIKATNDTPGSNTPNAGPQINKKEATTEVQVMNGETVVIGGIYQDSDNITDSGVPFLMDIPLLGWLFKSNSTNKTKTELLIFITPRLVN